MALVCLWD